MNRLAGNAKPRGSIALKQVDLGAMTAMAVASLAACRPASQVDQAQTDKVPVATAGAAVIRLDLSPSRAPPVELSHAAANEEFGIRAVFPGGSAVCEARSGSRPVGFFADIDRARDCESPEVDGLVRMIGIRAGYNALLATSAQGKAHCPGEIVSPDMSPDLREFAFPGMESVSCASREKDGQIWVEVAALGGALDHNDPPDPPTTHSVIYTSLLATHGEHLREDLALYREFLRRLRFLPLE